MFTCPVSGSGFLFTGRPSVSSGTINNPTYAYDLPSSRPDDPPYSTYADVSLVGGSSPSGAPSYTTVEYNTFPSWSKTNFATCQLTIGLTVGLREQAVGSTGHGPPNPAYFTSWVTSDFSVDYQVDGTNWVTIKLYTTLANAQNSVLDTESTTSPIVNGSGRQYDWIKETISIDIPSSAFTANLSNLKVRFRLGTVTNSVVGGASSGFYGIYDIRANLS
jgi:hypothetical protein